ncbi:hypothetical protein ACJX0J_017899, partial [Zea mays]
MVSPHVVRQIKIARQIKMANQRLPLFQVDIFVGTLVIYNEIYKFFYKKLSILCYKHLHIISLYYESGVASTLWYLFTFSLCIFFLRLDVLHVYNTEHLLMPAATIFKYGYNYLTLLTLDWKQTLFGVILIDLLYACRVKYIDTATARTEGVYNHYSNTEVRTVQSLFFSSE